MHGFPVEMMGKLYSFVLRYECYEHLWGFCGFQSLGSMKFEQSPDICAGSDPEHIFGNGDLLL